MKIKHENRVSLSDGKLRIDNYPFQLDNIDLDCLLDSGSNAIIITGRDKELDRPIIIKIWIINPKDTRDKIIQGREESRKIAKLDHKRIAKVYTSGVFENRWYYLVMERIFGETLRIVLTNKPAFSKRYDFWYEIEDGMKYAHGQNIYHGDLHSNNIMVEQDHIKILDFGTSIFNQGNSTFRESRLIESLVKEIFYENNLEEFQLSEFKNLSPELCLSHCSAWAEIIFAMNKFTEQQLDDYMKRYYLFHIAYRIQENPFFRIQSIFDFLFSIGLDEIYLRTYLDHLIAGLESGLYNQNPVIVTPNFENSIEEQLNRSILIQNKLIEKSNS